MTPEELLKPRYKVIADYPLSHMYFEVGDIMTYEEKHDAYRINAPKYVSMAKETVEKYPHLFQRLEWWQDRKEEDLPEYVKIKSVAGNYSFHKIGNDAKWSIGLGQLLGIEYTTGGGTLIHYIEPSTKEEYENQKK